LSAPGGKRKGAGAKSKQVIADEARATEIARAQLARYLLPIVMQARKLCMGVKRKKFYPPHVLEQLKVLNPKVKPFYYEMEYDSRIVMFWIDRFVSAARQGIDIKVGSPEEFYIALAKAEKDAAMEKQNPPIETKAIPEPDNKEVHDSKNKKRSGDRCRKRESSRGEESAKRSRHERRSGENVRLRVKAQA